MNSICRILAGLAVLGIAAGPARAADDAPCAALKHFKKAHVHVDSAGSMGPTDKVDPGIGVVPPFPVSSSFCRVQATLTPTADSHIRIEVWLPEPKDWNGRLGFRQRRLRRQLPGSVPGRCAPRWPRATPPPAPTPATRATPRPAGTRARTGRSAIRRSSRTSATAPRRTTALTAKALVRAYYRHPARYAYFSGCSDGGREALMEAQRFPEDFNGIVAGAPAYAWTGLITSFAWDSRARLVLPDQSIPPIDLSLLQDAVLKKCDALDGVEDGVIDDPRKCDFDPAALQCAAGQQDGCLSAEEVAAVRKIYQGPVNPATSASIYPGFPPGGEAVQWNQWITGKDPDDSYFSTQYFRNMVYGKPDWTLDQIDFASAVADGDARTGEALTADNPDLGAFVKRGGKLILFHGWDDGAIPAQGTIDYYEKVRARMGAAADASVRLYMVPGMAHRLGGPGPNSFDLQPGLQQWVEGGAPPQSVIASKYSNDLAKLLGMPTGAPVRTRPLCPYPQVARWTGSGSTDEAANFACAAGVGGLEPRYRRSGTLA